MNGKNAPYIRGWRTDSQERILFQKDGVIVDGNIITGKGPAFAMDFALALIEEISGRAKADEVAEGRLYGRK